MFEQTFLDEKKPLMLEALNNSLWVIIYDEDKKSTSRPSLNVKGTPAWKNGSKEKKTRMERTWSRARQITNDDHILTVSDIRQRPFFNGVGKKNIPGEVIYQPEDHGSAPAVCIALAFIHAKDPEASVVILPMDSQNKFCARELSVQVKFAQKQLLNEGGEDKILACNISANRFHKPHEFEVQFKSLTEKKSAALTITELNALRQRTIDRKKPLVFGSEIIVSKAELLWRLYMESLPDLFDKMEYVHEVIKHFNNGGSRNTNVGREYIAMATSHAYYHLSTYDFIKDLINNRLTKLCLVSPSPQNLN